jgi:hypothetical protein
MSEAIVVDEVEQKTIKEVQKALENFEKDIESEAKQESAITESEKEKIKSSPSILCLCIERMKRLFPFLKKKSQKSDISKKV